LGQAQRSPYATEIINNLRTIKENDMRDLIKITTIWSLLIIVGLLSGCGGGGDSEKSGQEPG